MPQSLSRIHIHLVFSTRNRQPLIDDDLRTPLHKYMAGILNQLDCPAQEINSIDDHVLALFNLSRTRSISDVVKDLKTASSKWIKTQGDTHKGFAWQTGYGAFAVSYSNIPDARAYILNQRDHHRVKTFQEEFRQFLDRHGITCDERYVWD